MKKRLFLMLALIFALLLAAGCSGGEKSQDTKDTGTPDTKVDVAAEINKEWEASGHAKVDTAEDSPALREQGKCFTCHNGKAFAAKAENMAAINNEVEATTCDACHSETGKGLMEAATVTTAIGEIALGKANLCISCHNGRGKVPDNASSPHHSVQGDMLVGINGAETAGKLYITSAHATVADACVTCHLAKNDKGYSSHTFKIDPAQAKNACGSCHSGLDTFNRPAPADYDGDGTAEGIQDEVQGLQELVKEAIDEKLAAGGKYVAFISSHGNIDWENAAKEVSEEAPSEELYKAAWNYFFVDFDGSKGVHNPVYTVQLLQQSYKLVTGKDVPNAVIR
jgi:nitrate/TMAO reductase-like tetraheme cytochrome c subunit